MISVFTLALFAILAFTLPLEELLWRIVVSGIVFAIGLGLFALRLLGAGDVKLLSVLMLFVPSGFVLYFSQIFSIALLIGVGLIVVGRRSHLFDDWGWKSINTPGVFPMGISISMTGIVMVLTTLSI